MTPAREDEEGGGACEKTRTKQVRGGQIDFSAAREGEVHSTTGIVSMNDEGIGFISRKGWREVSNDRKGRMVDSVPLELVGKVSSTGPMREARHIESSAPARRHARVILLEWIDDSL